MGDNSGWEAIYAEIGEAEEKARRGDVNAMLYAAHLHNNRADFASSLSWYEKAAEAGSAEAMYQLGMWNRHHNPREAARWFKRAATLGHGYAAAEAEKYDGAIKALTEIVGENAASLTLAWGDTAKIAGILHKKFPETPASSLSDDKLMSMMLQAGIRQLLPAASRPGDYREEMRAVKAELTRILEGS